MPAVSAANTKAPSRTRDGALFMFDRSGLLRRDPDPVLVRAIAQQVPIGLRDIPVHDGTIAGRALAVGARRRLHGIIDIHAASEQQCAQDHSEKSLHGEPPVTADNVGHQVRFRGAIESFWTGSVLWTWIKAGRFAIVGIM